MKKTILLIFILYSLFVVSINLYSADEKDKAEKYFNIAVKYYLEGDLNNAINVLTRALQKDKDNVRYSALYDLILEENEKLKIIRFDIPYPVQKDTGSNIDYHKLIIDFKKYLNKKSDEQNKRVINLINALSKENTEIRKYQEQVIDKKIALHESIIADRTKQIKFLVLAILSFFIFFLILFILLFIFLKKIKKTEEKLKILSLKQDEQQSCILKLKDEQEKLIGKSI